MKSLMVLAALTFASNAFAISNEALASKCLEKGKEKVALQAEAFDCKYDMEAIEVQEIDNRLLNPSKYIWYVVPAECNNGYDRVTSMVQYYRGKCL